MQNSNLVFSDTVPNSVLQSQTWASSFYLEGIRILIVCRGPVRLEAIEVFSSLKAEVGILLSNKDSIDYSRALSPELRFLDPQSVHRITDYTGASQEERLACVSQILQIAKEQQYHAIFAGYGFMSEDAGFVEAIEAAGLIFIGPASKVHRLAGAKDTAKTIARRLGVSVTPGADNITALSLLDKLGGRTKGILGALDSLVQKHKLNVKAHQDPEVYAENILQASYKAKLPLLELNEIQMTAKKEAEQLFLKNPKYFLRLKYIGGGGGKGQRIVRKVAEVPNAVLEILSEVKAMGDTDNRNFLIELNIENTRHNEVQVIGNGDWVLSLGGRDCSLQIHEQKLVEMSLSQELLQKEIDDLGECQHANSVALRKVLEQDKAMLQKIELQSECFAKEIALNSASTFECIVSQNDFFFMEMNTRIQVEHRVTEMIYKLRFVNPDIAKEQCADRQALLHSGDCFELQSLIGLMGILAIHGKRLPKPEKTLRHISGGEVRLNAQNAALQPSAGGMIEYWSKPISVELRDDQGISRRNPDSAAFISYHLAGAYDSNIALLVSHGASRRHNLENLAEILRVSSLYGLDLQTNRDFHYGILHFCLALHPMLKPSTNFVNAYLAMLGLFAKEQGALDLEQLWKLLEQQASELGSDMAKIEWAKQKHVLARVLNILGAKAHVCVGWIKFAQDRYFSLSQGVEKVKGVRSCTVEWLKEPATIVQSLYHYLHLEERLGAAPIEKIWQEDAVFLRQCQAADSCRDANPETFAMQELRKKLWKHSMKTLEALIVVAHRSLVFEVKAGADLVPEIPDIFLQSSTQHRALRYLAPPPMHAADVLVAQSSGIFYSRETPDSPPYLGVAKHFNKGEPIYIIEVMKMFNKIYAEFSGTVEEVLIDLDTPKSVKKGQPLFRVKADEELQIESEEVKQRKRKQYTQEIYRQVLNV